MLDVGSWLPQAEALEQGRKARVQHDCGEGTPMIVEHKEAGWSAWCHRCGDKGWKPKPAPTLGERIAARDAQRSADEAIRRDPRPPMPADFNIEQWPLQARVWLYKAGLFQRDIAELGAYFHERTGRVVLPVVDEGRLVYWQGRNVGLCPAGAPKYINPEVDRKELCPRYGQDGVIVLAEDILSAFRLGQVSEGWALMGTKLHTPVLARLIKEGKPVLVWLDMDVDTRRNSGQVAAASIIRTLTNVGIRCANIIHGKDAKALSRAEVIHTISFCLSKLPTVANGTTIQIA